MKEKSRVHGFFLGAAAVWFSLGLFVLLLRGAATLTQVLVLAALVAMGALNILVLAAWVRTALALAAGEKSPRASGFRALLLGILKLAFFGVYGIALFRAASLSTDVFVLGMATVFFIPVFGGLAWKRSLCTKSDHSPGSHSFPR